MLFVSLFRSTKLKTFSNLVIFHLIFKLLVFFSFLGIQRTESKHSMRYVEGRETGQKVESSQTKVHELERVHCNLKSLACRPIEE